MYRKHDGTRRVATYKRTEGIREFENQSALFGEAIRAAASVADGGMFAEFGVYQGKTLRMIQREMAGCQLDRPLFGFDSFEGLSEDYTPYYAKGKFAIDSPQVLRLWYDFLQAGAELVPGYFQDSLEPFLVIHPGHFAFVHLDVDLYSSTKFVLDTLVAYHRLVVGTVIQFDEAFLVRHEDDIWYYDEFLAWTEFLQNYDVEFKYIGAHSQRLAVLLTKI